MENGPFSRFVNWVGSQVGSDEGRLAQTKLKLREQLRSGDENLFRTGLHKVGALGEEGAEFIPDLQHALSGGHAMSTACAAMKAAACIGDRASSLIEAIAFYVDDHSTNEGREIHPTVRVCALKAVDALGMNIIAKRDEQEAASLVRVLPVVAQAANARSPEVQFEAASTYKHIAAHAILHSTPVVAKHVLTHGLGRPEANLILPAEAYSPAPLRMVVDDLRAFATGIRAEPLASQAP